MRILLTGANGLLGSAIRRRLAVESDVQTIPVDRAELDITDVDAVHRFITSERPDWIINCAAFTRVDDCEANEETATDINGRGAGYLAAAAAKVSAGIMHISTDYVFDGHATAPISVDAPTGPPDALSAYGRSKLAGERGLLVLHPNPTIVRTAWLYGPDGPCFPAAILKLARDGKLEKVVDDQRGAPTYAADLADAIARLVRVRATGIYHFTNSGSCTWFEFARAILAAAKVDRAIRPCTTAEFPRPAKRPAYSVLDLSAYERATGHAPRSWQSALADYMSLNRS